MSAGIYQILVEIALSNYFGEDRVVCQLTETTWDAGE